MPLIGPLDALEVELLEGWRAHADETVGNDRCGVLIGRHEAPRRLIDRQRLLDRITDALRAVTGRAGVRPHHLRHTFASRTALLLCLRTLPGDETVRTIVQRLVGPCDPEATRRLLLDTDEPSKRALWALSLAIGHASPATTLRWYVHVHELLQVLALHELEAELAVRLDTVTAAYTCGQQVRRSRHLVTVDGAWASRHFAPGAIEALPRASMSQPTPALSPRRASPSAPPEPLAVDRLLEQVHRRSRVDGLLAHRLMLRPEVIGQLLQQVRPPRLCGVRRKAQQTSGLVKPAGTHDVAADVGHFHLQLADHLGVDVVAHRAAVLAEEGSCAHGRRGFRPAPPARWTGARCGPAGRPASSCRAGSRG